MASSSLNARVSNEYESSMQKVMGLVQKFINLLRSTFEIMTTHSTANHQPKVPSHKPPSSSVRQQKLQNTASCLATTPEYQELGAHIQQLLVQTVHDLQQQPQFQHELFRNTYDGFDSDDERLYLLYQIVLPLVDLLYYYCSLLDHSNNSNKDERQQDKDKMNENNNNEFTNKSTIDDKTGRKATNKTPPPPSFLLSLQQYTDVAALMEVWVCYSVMVHKDVSWILSSLEDRCRFALPKALQGRLPRSCLLWAKNYHDCNNTNTNNMSKKTNPTHYNGNRQTTQQQQQLCLELRRGVISVTRLLLLDRFRPMLLPRHVTDLYAAILLADHIMHSNNNKAQSPNSQLSEDDPAYRHACIQLGLKTIATSTPAPSTPEMMMISPLLQARTCQTLLRQGTKTPLWVRQRVTPPLSNLACHHLMALVQVFVVAEADAHHKNNTTDGTSLEQDDTILVGASLRLAHAILLATTQQQQQQKQQQPSSQQEHRMIDPDKSNSIDKNERAQQVCQQLFDCLSVVVERNVWDSIADVVHEGDHPEYQYASKMNSSTSLSRTAVACIRTVQAVLEQMSNDMLVRYVLPQFQKLVLTTTTTSTNNKSLDETTTSCSMLLRQLGAILALSRPDFTRLTRLFLLPMLAETSVGDTMFLPSRQPSEQNPRQHTTPTTLLNLIICHAAHVPKVEIVKDGDNKHAKRDAKLVLQLWIQAMSKSSFTHQTVKVDGIDVMCLAVIYAVALGDSTDKLANLLADSSRQEQTSTDSMNAETLLSAALGDGCDRMMHDMEQRAQWVIRNLLTSPLSEGNVPTMPAAGYCKSHSYPVVPPSRFLQWLLWLYFSSSPSSVSPHRDKQVQLAVMMLLPLVCEQVPPSALLLRTRNGNDNDEEEAILPLIKLILVSCAAQRRFETDISSQDERLDDDYRAAPIDPSFAAAQCVLHGLEFPNFLKSSSTVARNERRSTHDAESKTLLFSIGSVVLSLLVAMLELGVENRPQEQEVMLQSFMPCLERLASLSNEPVSQSASTADPDHDIASTDSLNTHADIAEMASHAMVLIASRKACSKDNLDVGTPVADETKTNSSSWERVLDQARCDLASDLPPIRARGIVSLRHFVRDDRFARHAQESNGQARSLIVEVTSESKVPNPDRMLYSFLDLCLKALSDSESFVYLASIHTIVAAADVNPRLVLPNLAISLCTGGLAVAEDTIESTPIQEHSDDILLSTEQRIKLAEALIFIIRRRATIYEYIPVLMAYLVQGTLRQTSEHDQGGSRGRTMIEMQAATHQYFIHGNDEENDDYEPRMEDQMEARSIRVATGGPVFATEESDTLRASCLQVVAEMITVSQPGIMAEYCPILAHLATSALTLEASRLVRRAAALLSRELYAAVRRELDEIISSRNKPGKNVSSSRLLTIALVSGGEEKLFVALERSIAPNTTGTNKHQQFGLDPATVVRCKEALELRDECEASGILAAAQLVVDARRRDDNNPAARLLKELLKGTTECGVVNQILCGELDMSTLSLNVNRP